jgi:hypothetical protein
MARKRKARRLLGLAAAFFAALPAPAALFDSAKIGAAENEILFSKKFPREWGVRVVDLFVGPDRKPVLVANVEREYRTFRDRPTASVVRRIHRIKLLRLLANGGVDAAFAGNARHYLDMKRPPGFAKPYFGGDGFDHWGAYDWGYEAAFVLPQPDGSLWIGASFQEAVMTRRLALISVDEAGKETRLPQEAAEKAFADWSRRALDDASRKRLKQLRPSMSNAVAPDLKGGWWLGSYSAAAAKAAEPAVEHYAADFSRDPSFVCDLTPAAGAKGLRVERLHVLPDGRLIAAYYDQLRAYRRLSGPDWAESDKEYRVARLEPDGKVDRRFEENAARWNPTFDVPVDRVAHDSEGGVYLFSSHPTFLSGTGRRQLYADDPRLIRLAPDGRVDPTFAFKPAR